MAISYEVRDGGIAHVTIDRGEKKNALTRAMLKQLRDIAVELNSNENVLCVVLSGTREAFSAGFDLNEAVREPGRKYTLSERRISYELGAQVCEMWENLPQITISAVEGFNVGGGIALTLACDFRVMADDAYLYVPEVQIGIPLAWNSLPRLINITGLSRAKQILLLGEKMNARQAHEWGLADFLVPAGKTVEKAWELAEALAKNPVEAMVATKRTANRYANALTMLSSQHDVYLSMLFSASDEAVEARTRVLGKKK